MRLTLFDVEVEAVVEALVPLLSPSETDDGPEECVAE